MANIQEVARKQRLDFVALRGLDARLTWATAAALPDDDRCDERGCAGMEAHNQGRWDFQGGRDFEDVPPLLADVAYLAHEWRSGWMYEAGRE